MIIFLASCLGIILGYIKKGSIKNLENVRFNNVVFFILGFFLQIPLRLNIWFANKNPNFLLGDHIYIISLILILLTAYSNLNIAGIKLLTFGSSLNFLAIVSNGGKMPVSLEAVKKAGIIKDVLNALSGDNWIHFTIIEDGKTLFPFFGDIIPISLGGQFSRVISIGDLLIAIGIVLFFYSSMRKTPTTT